MLDEINAELPTYFTKWRSLIGASSDQAFFENLKPVAVGWKVADAEEYHRCYWQLHDDADKIIETWMNGRWIAKVHLKKSALHENIQIIKIMQRRPGSSDKLGLDHVDFYGEQVRGAEEVLQKEPKLRWTHESNDVIEGYEWLSLWFDNYEAKLRSDTVLDTITKELQLVNKEIKSA